MSTAQTIINEALQILNLNNGLLPVDPRHQQVAYQKLVDILILWRGEGRYITPQIPASPTQDIREKPWAKLGLVYETAFYTAAPLQVLDFPPTAGIAREMALKTLYVNARPDSSTQYPDILPIGGGNEFEWSNSYQFYGQQDNINYDIYDTANQGEALIFYADFDADAVMRNTSVSSVVWEALDSGVVISNQSITANVANALVTFSDAGTSRFKATATYASGEIKEFNFKVTVPSGNSIT